MTLRRLIQATSFAGMALVAISSLFVSTHILGNAWIKSNSMDLLTLSRNDARGISDWLQGEIQRAEFVSFYLETSRLKPDVTAHAIYEKLLEGYGGNREKGLIIVDNRGNPVSVSDRSLLDGRVSLLGRDAVAAFSSGRHQNRAAHYVASAGGASLLLIAVPRILPNHKFVGATEMLVDLPRGLSRLQLKSSGITGEHIAILDSAWHPLFTIERQMRTPLEYVYEHVARRIGQPDSIVKTDSAIVALSTVPSMKWHVVAVEPLSTLAGEIDKLETYIGELGGIGILIALALSFFVSSLATKPLNSLTKALSDFGERKRVYVPPQGTTEMKSLIRTFNEMSSRIEDDIEELQKFNRLGKSVLADITTDSFPDRIADAVRDLISAERCLILIPDESKSEFVIRGFSGRGEGVKGIRLAIDAGLTGHIYRTGIPTYTNDYMSQPYKQDIASRLGDRSYIGAPLLVEGEPLGVVAATNKVRNTTWTDRDLDFLSAFANEIAVAIQNHLLVLQLNRELNRVKQLQAELIQSEKLATLGQLISGIAHELNNPLGVVIGYSEIAAEQNSDPDISHHLEKILISAKRASTVVENFLKFSRKSESKMSNVRLDDVVDGVLRLMEHQFRVAGVAVVRDFEKDLPEVVGNTQELQQVLVNIFANALQALDGRDDGVVDIRMKRCDQYLAVIIADNGPGIPEDIVGKIFDPFFTTKPVGKGTGLGLSICYELVKEHHHGNIRVQDNYGKGATFEIQIPIASSAATKGTAEGLGGGVRRLSARVLVVDDEAMMRELIRDVLLSSGCEVVVADNGHAALKELASFKPDIILSDLLMPDMNGKLFYERCLARDGHYAGRFVFITGDTAGEGFREFLVQSRAEVITKPFSIQEMIVLIDKKLQNLRQKSE